VPRPANRIWRGALIGLLTTKEAAALAGTSGTASTSERATTPGRATNPGVVAWTEPGGLARSLGQ
jgi:hypothetical protein